jgi:hypothetical protein
MLRGFQLSALCFNQKLQVMTKRLTLLEARRYVGFEGRSLKTERAV